MNSEQSIPPKDSSEQRTQESFVFYRSAGVWVALALTALFLMGASSGGIGSRPMIGVLLYGLGWIGYIIFRKGKNGSFLVGFFVGIISALFGLYLLSLTPYMTASERKEQEEMNRLMGEVQADLEREI